LQIPATVTTLFVINAHDAENILNSPPLVCLQWRFLLLGFLSSFTHMQVKHADRLQQAELPNNRQKTVIFTKFYSFRAAVPIPIPDQMNPLAG